jgi:hypothetical protein
LKSATLHKEEIKGKNGKEMKDLLPPIHKLGNTETIAATNYKKDTILILKDGQFYEFNIVESRMITHTKP